MALKCLLSSLKSLQPRSMRMVVLIVDKLVGIYRSGREVRTYKESI